MFAKIDTNGGWPSAPLRFVEGQCWTFDSWHNDAGYPYVRWEKRDQPAHRVVYALVMGVDLAGLDLDHVCRNRACVNPGHEEPVTHAENQRRLSVAQTSCRKAGHDWTDPKNVRIRRNGRRYCAECERIAQRARHAKKKESAA